MIKCPKCGTDLQDDAKICELCGPINISHEVKGGLHDSVAVRSPGTGSTYAPSVTTIVKKGDDKRYCPSCKTPISEKNRSIRCFECGEFFCAACEGDFREFRKRGEKPLCYNCYSKNQKSIEKMKKPEPKYSCPICNQSLSYVEQYKNWYCNSCKKYPYNEKSKNQFPCPNCNKPLSYIYQNQSWYCYTCKKYPFGIKSEKKEGINGIIDSIIRKIDEI